MLTSYEVAGKYIKYSERPTKRYDDDGPGKKCWVETAGACCCYYGSESASPAKEQMSIDKENRHRAEVLAAPRRVNIRSSIVL